MNRLCFYVIALRLVVTPTGLLADDAAAPDAQHVAFFNESILPVLKEHCFKCHGGDKEKGGLKLDSRSALVRGGDSGSGIDMDSPEQSILLEAVRFESYEMPPSGKLPDETIELLARWVAMGSPYPADMIGDDDAPVHESPGSRVTDEDRKFWSFQPIQNPPVPATDDAGWARTPTDRFILNRLAENGLQPNGEISPRGLLRRVYYDLTGLPPSIEAIQEFEADPSDLAYQKIVDSLLASPEYGERWGRHWMDLVRYAETNSYERDDAKPEVWRFRDYVIDSLNADKPFDDFTREQIAGDEMEFKPERLVATGYHRLGIWDDEPADKELAFYDDMDDIVGTTSQVFLGLTVHCARCHEHKIDPIPHADYYRMLSFFSGLNRLGVRSGDSVRQNSLRPMVPPSQERQYTEAKKRYENERRELEKTIREIEKQVQPDFQPVEHEDFAYQMNREAIVGKRVGKLIDQAKYDQYVAARKRLTEIERNKPAEVGMALCVTEIGSQARPTFVLTRGNPHAPADPVEPGFPEILGGQTPEIPASPNPETSGRRIVLADWLVSESNPMTARVLANRLWQYHFGRGIVRTPNDFGFQGAPPTHPLLLDYLASELIRADWHLKPLHRMLVTSSAYRMSSDSRDEAVAADPTNDYFWRFESRRLSAEEIRDSMLAATGKLNLSKGGPSIYPIIEAEVLAGQSRPGAGWGKSSDAERARRSVYIHIKRSLGVPLLMNFDAADTDFTCPVRFATIQPTQALGMFNSDYLVRQSSDLADLAEREAPAGDAADRVAAALRRVLQRDASEQEIAWGVELMQRLRSEHQVDQRRGLELFCLVALNLNEFIYLD
ncbi:PSD1 and planctomycete cytochrome C domain-containing protein [Rosistilla oblonga]|uniref:PSD1 and planctomycete cytochrome C domain-containing protein n=1 Tax=Rosistilla oblonga TaxID=2527990 RepID=UPI003A96BBAC